MLRPLLAAALLGLGLHAPALAQGGIAIDEPREWGASATPGAVQARARNSIRVSGVASVPGGVRSVTLNGVRASLLPQPGGGMRFSGFVPVRDDTRSVEVAAFPAEGLPVRRSFPVTPTSASRAYERPEEAFGGARFKGQRWAVVVGVSKYQDSDVTPLRFADADARAFHDFLRSERAGLGGFPAENVRLLLNEEATYRNIRSALFTFLKRATDNDVVVIYFAGHGMADPERPDNLYLIAHDTEADDIAGSGLPMKDVGEAVRSLYARSVVVVTDACHSAGVGGQGTRRGGDNPINQAFLEQIQGSTGGSVIFTASQANQYSEEDERWGGGHGVFTHHLLEGLGGAADEDRDRIVTLGEMMEYTRDRVRRDTRNAQIPSISQTAFDEAWPMSVVPDSAPAATRGDEGSATTAADPTGGAPRLPVGQAVSSALDTGDPLLSDGSHFETWALSVRRGDRVTVTMRSRDFDAYLTVSKAGGGFSRNDDDGAGETDARITFTAEEDAVFLVRPNSVAPGAAGAYTLLVEGSTAGGAGTVPVRDIRLGQTVTSALDVGDALEGDSLRYEEWGFAGRKGQQVSITLSAAAFDPYLVLSQDGGRFRAENDDGAGGADARLQVTLPADGEYRLRARALQRAGRGEYTLALSSRGIDARAHPAPTRQPTPLLPGKPSAGTLSASDPVAADSSHYDEWSLTGRAGERIAITLRSPAFDAWLQVYHPGGSFQISDDDSAGDRAAGVIFTFPADGTYIVRANSLQKRETGAYTLLAERLR